MDEKEQAEMNAKRLKKAKKEAAMAAKYQKIF